MYCATPFWLVEFLLRNPVNLMGVPLHVICHFSLVAFNNFSLSLIFVNLITCVLTYFSLGLSCLGLSVLPVLGWLFPFQC